MVKSKKILPNLRELELVRERIKSIKNRQGEYLRKTHYGCYLLCSQSGLRISEAVKFDLNSKTNKDLYRIEKPKGKKERYVAVPKKVIKELEANHWQPNQTNRWNFYHFLKKVKRELNISQSTELTPHTLRRAFTTYHAEAGLPLPLLSKLLGHSSIRTTALYWRDIYDDDKNDDTADILAGKKWLERKPLKTPPPIAENFPKAPKNPNSDIVRNKPLITEKPDNSLLTTKIEKKLAITNYQPQPVIRQISPKTPEKFLLDTVANKHTERSLINSKSDDKEQILLERIKQLEKQLSQVQAENSNLKLENKHLKALIRKDHETEARIIQSLPFKPNK